MAATTRARPTKSGLMLAAAACYNPEEAIPLWERMSELGGGAAAARIRFDPSRSGQPHPAPAVADAAGQAVLARSTASRAGLPVRPAAQ